MNTPFLTTCARALTLVFSANLVLVPAVRAEEARAASPRPPAAAAAEALQSAERMRDFLHSSGALSSSWVDTRKALLSVKQKVKDSRLDLDTNGIEFYRGKAKVMVDLERQRLRRASRYLVDNRHKARLIAELKNSGNSELTRLANNLELQAFADGPGATQAVLDEYLSYRLSGYEQAVTKLETAKVRQVMTDTIDSVDEAVAAGGDLSKLNRGLFADGGENDSPGGNKLLRWIVGAIAGVGLVVAVFFSLTTMTMTPFLTFMATVVGLLALLGRNGAFQSIFFGNPYGPHPGPYNPYNPWNPYHPRQPYPPPAQG